MTRIMYDGINTDIAHIPSDAQLVAGYVDGLYAWSDSDWATFPNALHVSISVNPHDNAGQVQDVEQGNGTIQEAVGWVEARRASGYAYPVIYCSLSNFDSFKQVFDDAHVAQPLWWVADYSERPAVLPNDMVAFQFQDYNELYDLSMVADYWPGVDPAPIDPPPVYVPPLNDPQEDSVASSIDGNAGLAWEPGSVRSAVVVCDPGFNAGAVLRPVIWGSAGPQVQPNIVVSNTKGSSTVHFDLNNEWEGIAGITVTTSTPVTGGGMPVFYVGKGALS